MCLPITTMISAAFGTLFAFITAFYKDQVEYPVDQIPDYNGSMLQRYVETQQFPYAIVFPNKNFTIKTEALIPYIPNYTFYSCWKQPSPTIQLSVAVQQPFTLFTDFLSDAVSVTSEELVIVDGNTMNCSSQCIFYIEEQLKTTGFTQINLSIPNYTLLNNCEFIDWCNLSQQESKFTNNLDNVPCTPLMYFNSLGVKVLQNLLNDNATYERDMILGISNNSVPLSLDLYFLSGFSTLQILAAICCLFYIVLLFSFIPCLISMFCNKEQQCNRICFCFNCCTVDCSEAYDKFFCYPTQYTNHSTIGTAVIMDEHYQWKRKPNVRHCGQIPIGLESLYFRDCQELTSLKYIYRQAKSLRQLQIEQCNNLKSIKQIKSCRHLYCLTLVSQNGIIISQLPRNLVNLTFKNCNNVAFNKNSLQNITHFDLSCSNESEFAFLSQMTKVESLSLQNTKVKDSNYFQHFHDLKSLDLSGTQTSFLKLKRFSKLVELKLIDAKIQRLNLPDCLQILLVEKTCIDIRYLYKLVKLQRLEMSEQQVQAFFPQLQFTSESNKTIKAPHLEQKHQNSYVDKLFRAQQSMIRRNNPVKYQQMCDISIRINLLISNKVNYSKALKVQLLQKYDIIKQLNENMATLENRVERMI